MGIMVIYMLNFPNRVFLLYFVVPVPAWVLGSFISEWIFLGVLSPSDNTAHAAHIAGALFGLLYVRTGWCLASLLPTRMPKWAKMGGPKLRVSLGRRRAADAARSAMRVDEILEKIGREGESSLTPAERSELEELSRRFRNRR